MKAALVLTGLARCWEKAYPSFKAVVLDRYDTDVYIDIWDQVGYYSGKGYLPEENGFVRTADNDRGFHDSGEKVDARGLLAAYNPKFLRVERFDDFEPQADHMAQYYQNAYTRPKNTICQAYKIMRGMELLNDNNVNKQTYDIVVRARPDIVLEHDPGMFERDTFYTLPSRNKMGKGTGDTIQIGSHNQITRFSRMYYDINNLYSHCKVSCPHEYTAEWIKWCGYEYSWKEMNVGAHVAHSPKGLYQEPE